MASKQATVDFITEQITGAGKIRNRKMFGEYAIYCNEKVVAFVCDDQLFVKPTHAGRMFLETVDERPAYPGSKPYFYIAGDLWEDHQWLTELIAKTAEELPFPKPKKRKQK
jgi:DNA transformation protein